MAKKKSHEEFEVHTEQRELPVTPWSHNKGIKKKQLILIFPADRWGKSTKLLLQYLSSFYNWEAGGDGVKSGAADEPSGKFPEMFMLIQSGPTVKSCQ